MKGDMGLCMLSEYLFDRCIFPQKFTVWKSNVLYNIKKVLLPSEFNIPKRNI